MSILSELKKLTGKQNAKVVSEALPDDVGGGLPTPTVDDAGSSVVVDDNGKYVLEKNEEVIGYINRNNLSTSYAETVYKDPQCTQQFSLDEARAIAEVPADQIKIYSYGGARCLICGGAMLSVDYDPEYRNIALISFRFDARTPGFTEYRFYYYNDN